MSIRQLYGIVTVVIVGNIILVLYMLEYRGQKLKDLKQRCDMWKRAAVTDALTGLYNRRYITDVLLPAIGHSGDNRDQTLVCLIDVDNFKWFNDAHSYSRGDSVLVQVGKHIKQQACSGDSIIRWGGDEFVLVIGSQNQTNISSWETTFDYQDGGDTLVQSGFCENSEGSSWIPRESKKQDSEPEGLTSSLINKIRVSLSVGCSPLEGSWTHTFARWDYALKRNKRQGQGRVTIR